MGKKEQEEKRRGGADRKVNSLNRTFWRKTRKKMSGRRGSRKISRGHTHQD